MGDKPIQSANFANQSRRQRSTSWYVDCSYSRTVWLQLQEWIGANTAQLQISSNRRIKVWWTELMNTGTPGTYRQTSETHLHSLEFVERKGVVNYKAGSKAITESQLQSIIIRLVVTQFNNVRRSFLYNGNSSLLT
jgi:hypothetical protein